MDAARLPRRARIRQRLATVEDEGIVRLILLQSYLGVPPPVIRGRHRVPVTGNINFNPLRMRRPYSERSHRISSSHNRSATGKRLSSLASEAAPPFNVSPVK